MQFFRNLIKEDEIKFILLEVDILQDTISVGELLDFEPEKVKNLMKLWCSRVDKVIEIDKEVHGKPTKFSYQANRWRGFTYSEYSALFNQHITPSEFPFYPVFNQLRQNKGGINSEKQRTDFTFHYELNEEDYVRILREKGFAKLLSFFFGESAKLSALLPLKKLFMHTYIVAPTGEGKSVLMEAMLYRMQKKYKKFSFILIDPHGDLAERVKRFNLNTWKERVVYIDPFLKEGYTPSFNPFRISDTSIKNLNHTAEQIILSFEEVLAREGGKMTEVMTNMLEKCIYFLLHRGKSNILDLLELLNCNEQLFKEAAEYDSFFNDQFLKPNNRTREGLLSRIGRLLNSPVMRNLLGSESTFDLERALNSGKIIIFNLGDLGEMTQIAIGKFLVASIKSIVRKRKKDRALPTFVFIDECQNFVSGSFEYILSQLRKYGLHLVLANQFVEQLGTQANSVKKNTAVKIAGGGDDNIDDIKDLIKIPKDARLNDYEFFLKVRHRSLLTFKSPSFLLKKKKKYYLSKAEEKELDNYQIEHYYRAIDQEEINTRTMIEDEDEKVSGSPKPPFDLFIEDND